MDSVTNEKVKRKRKKKRGFRKVPRQVKAEDFLKAYNYYFEGGHSKEQCGELLGVSRMTFNNWSKRYFENGFSLEGLSFIKTRKPRAKNGKSGTDREHK